MSPLPILKNIGMILAFLKENTMLIEIRPGEGGDDAKLFMRDLARVYEKYLEQKG